MFPFFPAHLLVPCSKLVGEALERRSILGSTNGTTESADDDEEAFSDEEGLEDRRASGHAANVSSSGQSREPEVRQSWFLLPVQ